jgi:hypothetical protein
MVAILGYELDVITRSRALPSAMLTHVGVLLLFIAAWGGSGIPLYIDGTFYDEARLLQIGVLALLLPWTAARCAATDRGDELVLLAATTVTRPSLVLAARAIALTLSLAGVILSGLPAMIVAQRMAAASAARLVTDEVFGMGLAVLATASAIGWQYACRSRLLVWGGATLTTLAVVWLAGAAAPSPAGSGLLAAGAGVIATTLLALGADGTRRHLAEARP